MFGLQKKSGGVQWLVVGLGNPGAQYEMTRHNAGFLGLDLLAAGGQARIRQLKYRALVGSCILEGQKCLLMKPQTFMNLSGEAVKAAADFYQIPPQRILVLFDDISLEVGRIRIRRKGSAGGHNGIKSIIEQLGSEEFPRIKIGVGKKPRPEMDLADWVLSRFTKEEEKALLPALEQAGKAARLIVSGQTDQAMNLFSR